MLKNIIFLFLVTLLPFFELRASIPLGILGGRVDLPLGYYLQGFDMHWLLVFVVCVGANILLGPVVYWLFGLFGHLILYIPVINRVYAWKQKHTKQKAQKYIQRYGPFGLALFIAVPLPGSGSYTGALAAHLLGIPRKTFFWANLVGVSLAGIIVTLLTLFVHMI